MAKCRRPWTPVEDEIVRKYSIEVASSLLDRTWSAVASHRSLLKDVRTRVWSGPRKLWTKAEDRRLAKYCNEPLRKLAKRFKRHSANAVKVRRSTILDRSRLASWTTSEEAKLRELWPASTKVNLLSALSRHSWSAICNRAQVLGVRRRPKLKSALNELKDAVRRRAQEDGVPLGKLGVEIGHPSYFQGRTSSTADLNKIAKAVEFFGGRLVIDWQDE
jgi:hypothetical protein